MYINQIGCPACSGTGKIQHWVASEINSDGTSTLRTEEAICGSCSGKGYTTYPVFTVEEAIKIAEHLGFEIIKED